MEPEVESINATIAIKFSDSDTAETFFAALEPETLNTLTDRSSISIKKEKDTIQLEVNAKDIIAFRSTLNSYLIWMKVLFAIDELFNR